MSDTSKPVGSQQPSSAPVYSSLVEDENNKEVGKTVKYGHHHVKVADKLKAKTSRDLTSTAIHNVVNQANNARDPDLYVATLTTLALFADTLMEAGLYEEVTAILTVLTSIIQDHEKSEEHKAENERIEVQEDKRRDEQYLRQKQTIEALYKRLFKQRVSLDLKGQESHFDDYLSRLETIWINP